MTTPQKDPGDRIAGIRLGGLRTYEAAELGLSRLTVLIGENGAGKSSLVEALVLLRRAASPTFAEDLGRFHKGLTPLLRVGERLLRLGVRVEGPAKPLEYELVLGWESERAVIESESLDLGPLGDHPKPLRLIQRTRAGARVFDSKGSVLTEIDVPPLQPLLGAFGLRPPHHAIARMVAALDGIQVHLPFDVLPTWASAELGRESSVRTPKIVVETDRLFRFGTNLVNVFQELKNAYSTEHWQGTMDLVRLGLGPDVQSLNVLPAGGAGMLGLWVKYATLPEQVPAASLSDGTLSYLAFVALARLAGARASLLVFDEPELHLHPRLLARVLGLFEMISETTPVLLTTHSNHLLDCLLDPVESAVLCELDGRRRSVFMRPNAKALADWMKDYSGLGEIRRAGYESEVFGVERGLP